MLTVLRRLARPLSHAEVCQELDESGFDRATLYRNLIDLSQRGLAVRRDLGDHIWRFEATGVDKEHEASVHPHFICTECGEISCLPDGAVQVGRSPTVPASLRTREVEIQVRGTCDGCAA